MENNNRHLPVSNDNGKRESNKANSGNKLRSKNDSKESRSTYNNYDFLYGNRETKFEPNFLGKIVLFVYKPILVCLAFYVIYLIGNGGNNFLKSVAESTFFKGFSFVMNFLDAVSILLLGVGFFTVLAFFMKK